MFCPECGQEYQDGVTICVDCDVALQPDPPSFPPEPKPEWLELETVLETSDPARLAVAKSLLDAEEIPSFSRGEMLQELMGVGRAPSGTNLIIGPVKLQVRPDRAEEARALLAAVDTAEIEEPAGESADD